MKTITNNRINEKILYEELDSGLKVIFMPKPGFTKKHAVFSTNYGSNDNVFIPIGEDKPISVPEGIAHFLEHKLFEQEESNLFEKFSKMGAYVNAFTNFNQTAYLFETTDNFYESLELLVKFVQSPYLTDENVEKEKGIIAQEIKMYEDNPKWRVFFNCLRAMYLNHPVKIDIAGTVESIQTINKELLYKAYNTFYNPANMVLFIVGDLSFEKILEVVKKTERHFDKVDDTDMRILVDEPDSIKEKTIDVKMQVATPMFYIGFKDNELNLIGEELIKKDIITNMILDMMFSPSSKFYNDLYNEGLIYNSFGAYFTGKKTYGHSLVIGESNNPEKVQERVLELINKDPSENLLEEDFDRLKKKNLGNFLMGFNSVEFIANNFVDLYFDQFNLFDYLNLVESIEFRDLLTRYKNHLRPENMVISIVRPA
jgi:predicted Zn-dependent peptidase